MKTAIKISCVRTRFQVSKLQFSKAGLSPCEGRYRGEGVSVCRHWFLLRALSPLRDQNYQEIVGFAAQVLPPSINVELLIRTLSMPLKVVKSMNRLR